MLKKESLDTTTTNVDQQQARGPARCGLTNPLYNDCQICLKRKLKPFEKRAPGPFDNRHPKTLKGYQFEMSHSFRTT
ncbi:hypothetical protein JTE90_021100 [Oedothorax gibbosus]|uniref:Uncharacterized protein n=1 Tax=Oedothorax gibbosus TaxID=931172 RepID=A0AAV6TVS2_9ARAC|nr:hypothetical protein JTE90_021100 [Oedothorax gibbosus]